MLQRYARLPIHFLPFPHRLFHLSIALLISVGFHKTIQDEFYSLAFRKKLYASIEELQKDLDEWLKEYNTQRIHSGNAATASL